MNKNASFSLGLTDVNSITMDMQMKKLTDATFVLNAKYYNTNCFTPLVVHYDKSRSAGYISYMPYCYLLFAVQKYTKVQLIDPNTATDADCKPLDPKLVISDEAQPRVMANVRYEDSHQNQVGFDNGELAADTGFIIHAHAGGKTISTDVVTGKDKKKDFSSSSFYSTLAGESSKQLTGSRNMLYAGDVNSPVDPVVYAVPKSVHKMEDLPYDQRIHLAEQQLQSFLKEKHTNGSNKISNAVSISSISEMNHLSNDTPFNVVVDPVYPHHEPSQSYNMLATSGAPQVAKKRRTNEELKWIEIRNKQRLLDAYRKLTATQQRAIRNNGYFKGVPVKLFQKPFLTSNGSSPYFNNLQIAHWADQYGLTKPVIGETNKIDRYISYEKEEKWRGNASKLYWMSLMSVADLITRFVFIRGDHKHHRINWLTFDDDTRQPCTATYIRTVDKKLRSERFNGIFFEHLDDPDVHTMCTIIMYNGHFTSYFLNKKTGFGYYFDSCGNEASHAKDVKRSVNIHALDMSITPFTATPSERDKNGTAFNMCIWYSQLAKCTSHYFNLFAVQGGHDLCGMFTSLFLGSCTLACRDRPDQSPFINFWYKNDTIVNLYKNIMFIRQEDIDEKEYAKNVDIIPCVSTQYRMYQQIYNEALIALADTKYLLDRVL